MSLRAQYRDELLRIAEPYPPAAKAVVFCRYMVIFGQWAGIPLERMIEGLRRATGDVAVDSALPSGKGYRELDRLITKRLDTPPFPPPSTMYNVLRECVLDVVRKGFALAYVEGFLTNYTTGDWSGGGTPPLNGLTEVPAWVRR